MDEVNLLDYWNVLRKRKRIIILTFLLAVFISGILSIFVIPRTYEARTSLIVAQPQQPGALSAGLGGLREIPITGAMLPITGTTDLYVGILKSQRTAKQIVLDLDLQRKYKLDSLEKAISKLQAATNIRTTKEGLIEVKVEFNGSPQGTSLFAFLGKADNNPDSGARRMVAEMSKKYVEALMDYTQESVLYQAKRNRIFVGEQLKKTKQELGVAEESLRKFKEQHETVSLPEETKGYLENISKVELEKVLTQTELKEVEARLKIVTQQVIEQTKSPITSLPAHSPFIQDLRKQLIAQEGRLALALQEYGDSHPEVIKLKLQIEETKKELNDEVKRVLKSVGTKLAPELINLEADRIAYQAKLAAQKDVLIGYESKLEELPPIEMELSRKMRDVEVLTGVYQMLAEEYEKAKIAEAKEVMGFEVLDEAFPPEHKSKPRVKLNVVIAGLLGLFVGIFIAFFTEYTEGVKNSRAEGSRG